MKQKRKPSIAIVRRNAVLRYFYVNQKALEVAMNKPYELYAQEDTETIIEMIESEISNDTY